MSDSCQQNSPHNLFQCHNEKFQVEKMYICLTNEDLDI